MLIFLIVHFHHTSNRLRARKFQLIRLKPMPQVRTDIQQTLSKPPQQPAIWGVLNGITFSDSYQAPRGAFLSPTFFHPNSVLGCVSANGDVESLKEKSLARSETIGKSLQSSSLSSSSEFFSHLDMPQQEPSGTQVEGEETALATHTHAIRRAISDILEGCEHKRKIAVLSEVLEEMKTQSLQPEGQLQFKRHQAITPTLEKSFFGNEVFGCHATTKEKERNEDEHHSFDVSEKNSSQESILSCSSITKESLKINFVVLGDITLCNM